MHLLEKIRSWGAKKYLLLGLTMVLCIGAWLLSAHAQDDQQQCPVALIPSPDAAPFYGKKTCPIVGRMGNVRLAIPQNYILGPVAYKGVDIWNAESYKNRPKHPTLDTEIDNFAIKIRLSNFRPIESRKDSEDYDKLGRSAVNQPPENRWIYVGFKNGVSISHPGWTQKIRLENWLKDETDWGPFLRKEDIWGLNHYVSAQQPLTQRSPYIQRDQWEFFYDPKTEDTFLACRNVIQMSFQESVKPHILLNHCTIDFLMRKQNLEVSVDNIEDKDDLARWREIEQGITQLVESFVVQ